MVGTLVGGTEVFLASIALVPTTRPAGVDMALVAADTAGPRPGRADEEDILLGFAIREGGANLDVPFSLEATSPPNSLACPLGTGPDRAVESGPGRGRPAGRADGRDSCEWVERGAAAETGLKDARDEVVTAGREVSPDFATGAPERDESAVGLVVGRVTCGALAIVDRATAEPDRGLGRAVLA